MRELIVILRDDLDRSAIAARTEVVGWKGQWYRLDLTAEHADELESAVKRFIEVGEKISPDDLSSLRRSKGMTPAQREAYERNKVIRDWALEQDPPLPVNSGKSGWYVPVDTRRAWEEAHALTDGGKAP